MSVRKVRHMLILQFCTHLILLISQSVALYQLASHHDFVTLLLDTLLLDVLYILLLSL